MPELPTSPALAEATTDSLSELFSRNPATYTDTDLDKICQVLREQRQRFVQAEATGTRVRAVKAPTPIPHGKSPEDLGI